MNSLLLYLLQSAAGLLLFYGFYRLVLRREQSFRFNRFYLLGTPLLALLLPLVKIPVAVPEPVADTVWVYALPAAEAPAPAETPAWEESIALSAASPAPAPQAVGWGWPETILGLYLAGSLWFAYRLLRQLLFVRSLLRAHREQAFAWRECTVVPTSGSAPTFSFWRYIFLNDQAPLREAEREQILQHERVHVVQRHSLDLLYMSCLQVLFWFNPLLLLYHRALADTHEFIADQEAVQGSTLESYAQLMVRQLFHNLNQPLLHAFASSKTLNRIAMLKNPTSAPKLWKQFLVLPMLVVSVALLSFQRYPIGSETGHKEAAPAEFSLAPAIELASTPLTHTQAHPDEEKIAYWVPQKTNQRSSEDIPYLKLPSASSFADAPWDQEIAFFKGGVNAFRQLYLSQKLKLPLKLMKEGVEGLVLISFNLHPDGALSDVRIEKSLHPEVDESVVGFIEATEGQWHPKATGGVPDPSKIILPLWFLMDSAPVQPSSVTLPQGIYLKEFRYHGFYLSPPYYQGNALPSAETVSSEKAMAEFKEQMLAEFIKQITYPAAALAAKAEGVEVVEFMVHSDGTLSDFQVLHSKHPALAREVQRVLQASSGGWQPWVKNGKIVENKYRVQIRFRLEQQDAYVWNGYWF